MKKFLFAGVLFIFSIIFLAYFQACKRDSIKDSTNSNYSYKNDSLFATLDMATEIAENINKSELVLQTVDKNRLKAAPYLGKRAIKDKKTIMDKDNTTPYFYVINFDPDGYVIIPADKRLRPILSYGDNGYFKIDSLPGGLILWFETTAKGEKYLRESEAIQSTVVAAQWASQSCDESLLKSTQTVPCPPPTPSGNTSTVVTVGPLLQTTWDQGCNYNTYCPPASDGPCGLAYTGCVATSMAQIMYYWKYPSTYNWSSMQLATGSDATAHLMYNIGTAVGMSYGGYSAGGSSADPTKIPGAFKNTFHYSSATYDNYPTYNYQIVLNNLNSKEPVLLGGCNNESTLLGIPYNPTNCHRWVCDGYLQTTYYTNGVETSQTLYLDMNWGWGGSYNRWYAFDYWYIPEKSLNFQYFTSIVYNIHP